MRKFNFFIKLSQFRRNSLATMVILWGLTLTVITPLICLPYDYYLIIQNRYFLQNALDAATLSVKMADDAKTIEENINRHFQAILSQRPDFKKLEVGRIKVDILRKDLKKGETKYAFNLDATVDTVLMEHFLGNKVNVQVGNTISISKQPIEIAFVVDLSGSMGGGKLNDVKDATKDFINTLIEENDAGKVRVGIVPYSGSVNIKTTTPDYLGNQHNWTIAGSDKDIIRAVAAHDLQNSAGWENIRQTLRGFYTGNMWQYMDVEQRNTDVNGYYLGGAVYNGQINDSWNSNFTTVTDKRNYNSFYSPIQTARYRIDNNGNYVLYNTTGYGVSGSVSNPYPIDVYGTNRYNYSPIPYADDPVWGHNHHVGTNTRELPIWNNHFWLHHLLMMPWIGCVMTRYKPGEQFYDLQDREPTIANPNSLFVPMDPTFFSAESNSFQAGVNLYGFTSGSKNITSPEAQDYLSKKVWHYPDISRYYLNHTINWNHGTPYFPPYTHQICPFQPLLPLQTDLAIIGAYIESLIVGGTTNTTEGIKWAWNLLTPTPPFIAGSEYGDNKKVIIVITDGANWHGQRSSYGFGSAPIGYTGTPPGAPQAPHKDWLDNKMLQLCTNIKSAASGDAAIEIYTLSVEMNAHDTATAKNCATSPTHFYDIKNSSQTSAAFDEILTSIQTRFVSN